VAWPQVSFFVTTHERGEGTELHRHPYEETFLVEDGEVVFTIEDDTVAAHSGQIVVVPAGAAHSFESAGDVPLRQVSIHPAPAMETEWLDVKEP
jgi:mannose-6-phosphate isomerase-like protein (cupin superfamily)